MRAWQTTYSQAPSGLARISVSNGTTRIRYPSPGEMWLEHKRRSQSPEVTHNVSFGFAYVNQLARGTMSAIRTAKFPVGSILVREKLPTRDATKPEKLVVMIKRETGFNRKARDWEFLTVSGDLTKIEAREKQGKCQKCHASQSGNDYVFRYPLASTR